MIISEKQIIQLIQIANGVLMLDVPYALKVKISLLLDEIQSQQSEELKEIK